MGPRERFFGMSSRIFKGGEPSSNLSVLSSQDFFFFFSEVILRVILRCPGESQGVNLNSEVLRTAWRFCSDPALSAP